MEHCRMCENKFLPKDKDPEDGLCIMCHISLCQKGVVKCSRCANAIKKLIAWAMDPNNGDSDELEYTPDIKLSKDFNKRFKEKFKKEFGEDFKENFKE